MARFWPMREKGGESKAPASAQNPKMSQEERIAFALEAIKEGDGQRLRLALDEGLDPSQRDAKGSALIHRAALWDSAEALRELARRGADLEARDPDGRTPLMGAARAQAREAAAALLELGADPNAAVEGMGFTALHYAASKGDAPIIQKLAQAGASLEARDKDQDTPLCWASENGHELGIRALLEAGASLEARGKSQMTPLMWAAREGQAKAARELILSGASLQASDANGWSPLHHAAQKGGEEIVSMMLERGADPKAQTRDGDQPDTVANELLVRRMLQSRIRSQEEREKRKAMLLDLEKGAQEKALERLSEEVRRLASELREQQLLLRSALGLREGAQRPEPEQSARSERGQKDGELTRPAKGVPRGKRA